MDAYFNKAQEYASCYEYEDAFREYLKSAENGNTSAMNEIAMLYAQGKIEKESKARDEKTFKWFKKSADHGNRIGEFNVGLAYHQGLAVKKDIDEAIKWYEKSAKKGNLRAQVNLAYLYAGNEGIRPNLDKALEYIEMYSNDPNTELTSFSHLEMLRANIENELHLHNIEGKLFLKQSDAHKAAVICMQSNNQHYAQAMIGLEDIFLFPEIDDNILSDRIISAQCLQRKQATQKRIRLIPCYEVQTFKILARFGFLVEDETNIIAVR